MKIGIDCRMLGPEQGGLGRYVEQLVYHLSKTDYENEYLLFLRRANFDRVKIGSEQFKYSKVLADIPWYGWREQILFPILIGKYHPDIMHFPHWNVPVLYGCRFVVTVHDLLLFHYPTRAASMLGPISYWFKNFAWRLVLRHAVRSSAHIIAVSEFTKNDIHKTLSVPLEKITVTYQAPCAIASNPAHTPASTEIQKPYALYVGVAYPHKNLDRLLNAWKIVGEKTNHKYQLVLAGKKNYFYERLEQKILREKIRDIVFAGFVSDEELSSLYAGAALYVFPSLYEGFGLPPLDAWVHRIPVASSNRASLPEILSEGALYFDPESAENMADAIICGLTDENIRTELRLAALRELPRYSWEKLAAQTLAVYKKSFRSF